MKSEPSKSQPRNGGVLKGLLSILVLAAMGWDIVNTARHGFPIRERLIGYSVIFAFIGWVTSNVVSMTLPMVAFWAIIFQFGLSPSLDGFSAPPHNRGERAKKTVTVTRGMNMGGARS